MLHMKIQVPELDQRDWEVVQIAIRDAGTLGCAITDDDSPILSWLLKAFRLLTGHEPCRPLADERLETLRRFLTVSRRNNKLAERYIPDLLEFGFNRRQIEALALLEC